MKALKEAGNSRAYFVALQMSKPNPLYKHKRPGCKHRSGLTKRSGEVFLLDILSHRMSEKACLRQLTLRASGTSIYSEGQFNKFHGCLYQVQVETHQSRNQFGCSLTHRALA